MLSFFTVCAVSFSKVELLCLQLFPARFFPRFAMIYFRLTQGKEAVFWEIFIHLIRFHQWKCKEKYHFVCLAHGILANSLSTSGEV